MPKTKESKSPEKVRPLGDRVLIKEEKQEGGEMKSGIFIPESVSADRGAKKGRVVAVGVGKYEDGSPRRIPMEVKVGDRVLFQWGDKLTIDGEEYEMVAESGILAVVK